MENETPPKLKFVISIRLWSKKDHPLYGIPGSEHKVIRTGFVALPDPDPEMMDDPDYNNTWFFRSSEVAHRFDPERFKDIPDILQNLDSISIDDIEAVTVMFCKEENEKA